MSLRACQQYIQYFPNCIKPLDNKQDHGTILLVQFVSCSFVLFFSHRLIVSKQARPATTTAPAPTSGPSYQHHPSRCFLERLDLIIDGTLPHHLREKVTLPRPSLARFLLARSLARSLEKSHHPYRRLPTDRHRTGRESQDLNHQASMLSEWQCRPRRCRCLQDQAW